MCLYPPSPSPLTGPRKFKSSTLQTTPRRNKMPSNVSSPSSATPALPNPNSYANPQQNSSSPQTQPLLGQTSILPRLHPQLPSFFPFLPLFSAATWFATVFTLLIYWLASGRPHLVSMARSQRIAYISDVGAGRLKPLFIVGGAVSGLAFVTALGVERWARHRGRYAA